MMLGSLARHTGDYTLVQHVHSQLDLLEESVMSPKKHLRMKRALLHTLGNTAHRTALDALASHLDDEDLMVQHAAIKAVSNMPLEEAKALLVAVGTSQSRHNMVRRAACLGLADHDHIFADLCKQRLSRGSKPLYDVSHGESALVQEEPAADSSAFMAMLGPLLEQVGLPPGVSLNMTHAGDTQWKGAMGKKKAKVRAELDAVMAYDVAGLFPAAGMKCAIATTTGATGSPDFQKLFDCLNKFASFKAYLSGTGRAFAVAFGNKINVLRAAIQAAADLFPIPKKISDWSKKYRVSVDLSIIMIALPVWSAGELEDTRFDTNEEEPEVRIDDGDNTGHGNMVKEEGESTVGRPAELLQDQGTAEDNACQDGNPSLKQIWGEEFTLFSTKMPIGGPWPIFLTIDAGAGLAVLGSYHLAQCGSLLSASARGVAGIQAVGKTHLSGSVEIGFSIAGFGVSIWAKLEIPVITGGVYASAAIGAPIMSPGTLQGFGKVTLALPAGDAGQLEVGFDCLMIHKSAVLFRIQRKAWEKQMLYVKIEKQIGGLMGGDAGAAAPSELGSAVAFVQQYAVANNELDTSSASETLVQQQPNDDSSNFGFKTIQREDGPVDNKGSPDMHYCKKDEDCSSMICAQITSGYGRWPWTNLLVVSIVSFIHANSGAVSCLMTMQL